jgi:hypothetical protein
MRQAIVYLCDIYRNITCAESIFSHKHFGFSFLKMFLVLNQNQFLKYTGSLQATGTGGSSSMTTPWGRGGVRCYRAPQPGCSQEEGPRGCSASSPPPHRSFNPHPAGLLDLAQLQPSVSLTPSTSADPSSPPCPTRFVCTSPPPALIHICLPPPHR